VGNKQVFGSVGHRRHEISIIRLSPIGTGDGAPGGVQASVTQAPRAVV